MSHDIKTISDDLERTRDDLKEKDQQVVKTFNDYMQTYEALLKLRNEKGVVLGKTTKTKKDKKKEKKDMFDDLISSNKTKEPRHSVANLEMAKHI